MTPQKKSIIAAFDFDGTFTYRDSLVPFLVNSFGFAKTAGGLACELPTLLGYLISLKSRQETKENILTRFLKGLSQDTLHQMGKQFAEKPLQRLLKAPTLQRLRWHQERGHRCVLISASIDLYLIPWATSVGISDVLSSRLAFDLEGRVTGKLLGLNCWGQEKVRRLLELLGSREEFILYAYGDSAGDRELLAMADYPVHC